jgi:hypothetical protein
LQRKTTKLRHPLFFFRCLTQGLQFDASILESEEEEEAEAGERPPSKARGRKKSSEAKAAKKKRPRKVKSKRGYYASSSDEDDLGEAAEAVEPPAKRLRRTNDIDEVLAEVRPFDGWLSEFRGLCHRNLRSRRRMLKKMGKFFQPVSNLFCVLKRGFVEPCKNVPL